jgi:hypothetical protein
MLRRRCYGNALAAVSNIETSSSNAEYLSDFWLLEQGCWVDHPQRNEVGGLRFCWQVVRMRLCECEKQSGHGRRDWRAQLGGPAGTSMSDKDLVAVLPRCLASEIQTTWLKTKLVELLQLGEE